MAVHVDTQETAFVKYRDEKMWTLSTSDKTMQTKLKKLGYKPESKEGEYQVFKLSTNKVTFRKAGQRKKRKLSASAKASLAKNLEKARAARAKVKKKVSKK